MDGSGVIPWFGIRVFVIIDQLPVKNDELDLPRFGIRVTLVIDP